MYEDYAKKMFETLQRSDSDYLAICKNNIRLNRDWAWNDIPHPSEWETIDEAIRWHFDQGWEIVEIYDLYAEWQVSMIRSVVKVKDLKSSKIINDKGNPLIMVGDIVDLGDYDAS
jgi:hypothetical protein